LFVPILLYHHVVPDSKGSDLAPFIVDESDFIWQLDVLQELGYEPTTLSTLLSTKDMHKKVVITFDDCARNLIDHALPHLESKKWNAVFFAPFAHLGGCNEWNVRKGKTKMELMSLEEVQILADSGHEVGAHSMSHPHLNLCSPEEVKYEITESKKQLELLLKKPVESFAYPYGRYPEGYQELMKSAGYKCAVAMDSYFTGFFDDIYCIKRIVIEQGESVDSFRNKLVNGK
jgi:peptidoglycan/xylan/chitin deacetylase (PgdA/CDA1 family)